MDYQPWTMQLRGGAIIDLQRPDLRALTLDDVAWSLSYQCRFAGHTSRFYSVAEHSVLAARIAPMRWRRSVLFHDAHEALIGDLTRPFQSSLPALFQEHIRDMKYLLDLKIEDRFNVDLTSDEALAVIKEVDNRLLQFELAALMVPGGRSVAVPIMVEQKAGLQMAIETGTTMAQSSVSMLHLDGTDTYGNRRGGYHDANAFIGMVNANGR